MANGQIAEQLEVVECLASCCPQCRKAVEQIALDAERAATERATTAERERSIPSPYCPTCGSCGEPGCCTPMKCVEVKCKYGQSNLRAYAELEDKNVCLRERLTSLEAAARDGLQLIDDLYSQQAMPDESGRQARDALAALLTEPA